MDRARCPRRRHRPHLVVIRVEVTVDGESEEVDLDLAVERFTLKESVRLEEALGAEATQLLFSGADVPGTPKMIQALIWAKLSTKFPTIGLDDFDLDLADMADAFLEDEPSTADVERALFVTDGPVAVPNG